MVKMDTEAKESKKRGASHVEELNKVATTDESVVELDPQVSRQYVAATEAARKKAMFAKMRSSLEQQKKNFAPKAADFVEGLGNVKGVVVDGIITRAEDNPKNPAQRKIVVEVDKVHDKTGPDLICTGVPGFEYLMPNSKTEVEKDTAPERPASNGAWKKTPKEYTYEIVVGDPNMNKFVPLCKINYNVFMNVPVGDKEATAVYVAGTRVRMAGVMAVMKGDRIFLDVARMRPIGPLVEQVEADSNVISFLSQPHVLEQNALRLSHGRMLCESRTDGKTEFGTSSAIISEKERALYLLQRTTYYDKWCAVVKGAALSCTGHVDKLLAKRDASKAPEVDVAVLGSDVMKAHKERLSDPEAVKWVTGGKMDLFAPTYTAKQPSEYTKYPATVVHKIDAATFGLGAGGEVTVLHDFLSLLLSNNNDMLHEMFAMPEVTDVWNTEQSSHKVDVSLHIMHIGNKSDVCNYVHDVLGAGAPPVLYNERAVRFHYPLNALAADYTGIYEKKKAALFAHDLFKYGSWSAGIKVDSWNESDVKDSTNFVEYDTFAVDMRETLKNIAVRVSEYFVKKHLAGGLAAYSYEVNKDAQYLEPAVAKFKSREKERRAPKLSLHGYNEFTNFYQDCVYKFSTQELPKGYDSKIYYVWFPGIVKAVLEAQEASDSNLEALSGDVHTEAVLGEAFVKQASLAFAKKQGTSSEDADMDIARFCTNQCAIYCVAC